MSFGVCSTTFFLLTVVMVVVVVVVVVQVEAGRSCNTCRADCGESPSRTASCSCDPPCSFYGDCCHAPPPSPVRVS